MGELLRTPVLPHLAREDSTPARLEVLRSPCLVEERQRELALTVADHHLEQRALAVLHAALARASHLGDDRDRLADRQ
jgi:hypothetical protein